MCYSLKLINTRVIKKDPFVKIKKHGWLFALILMVSLSLFLSVQDVRATGDRWYKVAFEGSDVSFVAVNPYRQSEVIAVVDNVTKITLDGGLLWRTAPVPSKVISLAFDPVHPDEIYAGTQQGIYYSSDLGYSWSPFGSIQSRNLSVVSLTINNDAIFTTQSAGLGNGFKEVFKIKRSGETVSLGFPTPYVEYLTTDEVTGVVYAGTHDVLYRTEDGGESWKIVAVPGPGGIGAFTGRLVVRYGQIWLSSVDGVFVSLDSGVSWRQYAGYPGVTELYPNLGSSVLGLAVNGSNAFFGITNSYGSKEVFEVNAASVVKLDFKDYPSEIALGDGRLWVGGRTGLWRQDGLVSNQARVKRPLVIVPGTMGSWSVAGRWKLDPIGRTYDNLMKKLEDEGYVKGVTLFDFPYNWRQDNNQSAQELLEKIAAIKQICMCGSVDVVGHSQGGLVARAYIEGSHYGNDVENMIELGTPNAGSVETYSIWEGGVSVDQDIRVRYGLKLFYLEAIENGYSSLSTYIRTFIPSVGQLLPNYSYIKGRSYPNGYPANAFIDTLNSPAGIRLLRSRTNLYVVGSNSKKTLTGLEVSSTGFDPNWPHGRITNMFYGQGDGTVPIESLQSITYAGLLLNEDHGGLAKHPSELWMQRLLGDQISRPSNLSMDISKMMLVYVESPVRISLTDPSGNNVNDEVNDVEGAFYTGSNETVQFISILNPSDGVYKISLAGKGSGKYTVGVATFDDSGVDLDVKDTGETSPNEKDGYEFDMSGGQLRMVGSDARGGDQPKSVDIKTPPTSVSLLSSLPVGQNISVLMTTIFEPYNLSPQFASLKSQPITASGGASKKNAFSNFRANQWLIEGLIFFLLMLSGTMRLIWLHKRAKLAR
jgi:hypothetical protein